MRQLPEKTDVYVENVFFFFWRCCRRFLLSGMTLARPSGVDAADSRQLASFAAASVCEAYDSQGLRML